MNLNIHSISRNTSNILTIIAVVLGSTALLYLPFATGAMQYLGFQKEANMNSVYQNYDGLYYVVASQTWYKPEAIEGMRLEFNLPYEYYAAHLPLYPFFISVFALVLSNVHSMIVTSIFFTILLAVGLYFFLIHFNLSKYPVILVTVFLFLPRFFITRSVGAPETLFMFMILGSIFFFEKKQYLYAGILGALATMTKTPGILLFGAYGLVFLEQMVREKKFIFSWRWISLGLIPLGLVAVFTLYEIQYNNFLAYFNTGGVVPMPYPFSVFNSGAKWVDTVWLEEIILYFFLYGLAVITLKDSKYRSLFYFPLLFLAMGTLVQHRDLSRYLLPLWPFALIAFEKLFTSKKFLVILIILIPAIYLYAWNFMSSNIIPVSDWRPFL
ncbi:hypothetical protein KBD81_01470 [Candidatus Woesebacteria bacterium]|nr:hypothetical protein [Candidatus Woesebacteria bacterium]